LSKGLVIVESPAKAKTIQKYLGKGFTVEASLGHVKDLPKSTLGVDTDNEFDTEYIVIPGKEKVLTKLKKLAESADHIYLAPDPDREGEAIAAHLADELSRNGNGKKKKKTKKEKEQDGLRIQRVTFNEITQRAVREAFEHPRQPGRLPGFSAALGQSPPGIVGRTRPDRRAALDRRTRARDQGL
jgi:DNA topoisomerase-1